MATRTAERVERIPVQDLIRRMSAAEPVTILDVRGAKAWSSSNLKIAGAVRADPADFHADPEWPRDQLTVVY